MDMSRIIRINHRDVETSDDERDVTSAYPLSAARSVRPSRIASYSGWSHDARVSSNGDWHEWTRGAVVSGAPDVPW